MITRPNPVFAAFGAATLLLTLSAGCQPVTVQDAAATIDEADFVRRIGVLAHDSMGGRATPSPGLDMTARWIADEFAAMGLRGGAEDGEYLQQFPLVEYRVDADASGMTIGDRRLAMGVDMAPFAVLPTSSFEGAGGLVLVEGLDDPRERVPDQDVAGMHVIFLVGEDEAAQGVMRDLYFASIQLADAGALSVSVAYMSEDGETERDWTNVASTVRPAWAEPGASPSPRLFRVDAGSLASALAGSGVNLDELASDEDGVHVLASVTATLAVSVALEEIAAPNVVGILDGSDPELRNEYVVYSAHMDHVGTGTPSGDDDVIYNGADDNASGTVAVVEVAEAMAAMSTPPARSVVFLLVSGEERGLWGSEWFSENPTVPIESTVANINADMVGRNWTDTIVAIGKEHSDLGATLERVNDAHPELNMTAIDDLWPEQRFYRRSDHYNFARKGVPIIFFFNGTHDQYHQPDDEIELIDAEKASRVARLMFWFGLEVANAPERPVWDPERYREIVEGVR